MANIKRASLFGIPRELRLQIYNHVLTEDVDYRALEHMIDNHGAGGFYTTPVRDPQARLRLLWVSLMLSCRSIATELRSFMREGAASSEASDRRNYVLDMNLWDEYENVREVTWRRIPCAPRDIPNLVAKCDADANLSTGGDGGPRGIVRALYQILNLFLHCGPVLKPLRPLDSHIRLRELVVKCTDSTGVMGVKQTQAPQQCVHKRCRLLRMLCATELLSGYVDAVRSTDSTDERVLLVQQVEDAGGVPARRDRYGFQWGLASWAEREEATAKDQTP